MENQNQEISFKVTLKDAELILNALSQQPFAQVANLIMGLQKQAQEQLKPPEAQ